MKWINKGHEYDEIANVICNEKSTFYIWGWGYIGKAFYKRYKNIIKIKGAIDSASEKQGKNEDLEVFSPDEIKLQENEKILICTGWVKEVEDKLKSLGYSHFQDYFLLEEFSGVYELYKYNKLHLENVGLVCNEKCTLRCKHCAALIPYNKHQINYSYEEMKKGIDLLFNWVDSVGVFSVSGGDAMLNPDLERIVEYLGTFYRKDRISQLVVYTNAIIMPTESMLNVWKKYDVIIRFTDYSENVPNVQRISTLCEICDNNNVKYEHVRFESWVDLGYPQESNGLVKEEELIQHALNCSPVICSCLKKDKLFYCSPACMADASGLFPIEETDAFELSNYSADRKTELLEFYNGYSEKGYPSYCKRCNGLFNNNKKYVKVAEQLKQVKGTF